MTSTVLILAVCLVVPVVMLAVLLFTDPHADPDERRARDASRSRHPSMRGTVPHVRVLDRKPFDQDVDL